MILNTEDKKMKKACEMTRDELAYYIDYAVLKPETTEAELIEATKQGVALKVRSVCINPVYVKLLEPYVKGSVTKLSPVADFPFGTSSTASRIAQLEDVLDYESVEEIDIVMNYGLLRSGRYEAVTEDLRVCADVCHQHGRRLKVILETDALNTDDIKAGCRCCMDAGVDFVKTSTGFLTGHELRGAANDVVQVILDEVQGRCQVKGSGVIRTREHFLELIDMGVDRLGINWTSAAKILEEV